MRNKKARRRSDRPKTWEKIVNYLGIRVIRDLTVDQDSKQTIDENAVFHAVD
jgi:hypothetical protein